MRRTLATLLALALSAPPVLAADPPPPPPAGAPAEERLYLASATADALGLLVARVECVAFQRARIEARLDDGLLARGWTAEADRLWRLAEALARFEAAHIRPLIDPDTQDALLEATAPDGLAPAPRDETRAGRCLAFGDALALRRVTG